MWEKIQVLTLQLIWTVLKYFILENIFQRPEQLAIHFTFFYWTWYETEASAYPDMTWTSVYSGDPGHGTSRCARDVSASLNDDRFVKRRLQTDFSLRNERISSRYYWCFHRPSVHYHLNMLLMTSHETDTLKTAHRNKISLVFKRVQVTGIYT